MFYYELENQSTGELIKRCTPQFFYEGEYIAIMNNIAYTTYEVKNENCLYKVVSRRTY